MVFRQLTSDYISNKITSIIVWPLKKRIPLKDSGIFEGFTDWHSHILPGVDDGVQTMEEALEILRL